MYIYLHPSTSHPLLFLNIYYLFIYAGMRACMPRWVLVVAPRIFVAACRLLSHSMWALVAACGLLVVACKLLVAACMWVLVLRPGIEPGPPALGVWSLTHWTTRKVPHPLLDTYVTTIISCEND